MDNLFNLLAILTQVGLTLYALAHFVAVIFTWIGADPSNSLVIYINRITFPMWKIAEKYLPHSWRSLAPMACVLVIFWLQDFAPPVIQNIGNLFSGKIDTGLFLSEALYTAILATFKIIDSILFFILILSLIWFIISMTSAPINNPIVRMIYLIVEPILTPVRGLLPRSKIDVSPLVVALLAWIAGRLLKYLSEMIYAQFF